MTRHQYYYRPSKGGKRGRPKSTHTQKLTVDGEVSVPNQAVEQEILNANKNPDLKCGAERMTNRLQLMGFMINKKKVASLMKKLGTTGNKKRRSKSTGKSYIDYRVLNPTEPLTHLQMDIKSHWLVRDRCQSYTLTVLDTFTREVLGWHTGTSLKCEDVKRLWEQIITEHLEPVGRANSHVALVVISDNGPQFIAQLLKDFFDDNEIKQQFTHPYTPQENGYIESFHASMNDAVEREHFNLEELKRRLKVFYYNYNHHRTHTSTKGLPPVMFRAAWENDLVLSCYQKNKPLKLKLRYPLYEIPIELSRRELLATKKTRAQRSRFKKESGEKTSSAHNQKAPVETSPSVASCVAKEVDELILN